MVRRVARFRHRQLCPLARAAEVVGERWTLLILRELLRGPRRFTDLKARLDGVSASVLAQRVAALEAARVVARRTLAPPAASIVYELTDHGRALAPAVDALARWGVRRLLPVRRGERIDDDGVRLALAACARRTPTPARAFTVRVELPRREIAFRVAGGPDGTTVTDAGAPADAMLTTDAPTLLALATGMLTPAAALRGGHLRVDGESPALDDFPALFA
jgi:DNA-binding HxlR family transcriptional regulator